MLDNETKRRIDTLRDILVGKLPDPKSQVEQITIAIIYKFMDDMDHQAEELGGKRKFFAGDFAKYGWAKLMRSGLGGHEVLNLYAEAIARMPENPGVPPLFRSIFKNAFLPYRDPEILKMFLKVIDEFHYEQHEKLGDAFEYLLQVLGSQGDAGQFLTPRHIIDFIVQIVDPKKNETIMDPACGTAGFLISAYKHIMKNNTDKKGRSTLTPDEKGRLAQNFKGYDISPDMVRLSLVNLYLHGFTDPHIHEYDTLTSLEKWNEHADVILANPPFMSPKGGIQPHNRFSVQSKRSEVLFVDYMAEHLTPSGRAGIIVPEGIIFQSGTAYKQLRKMLVEDYLVAVISLPPGVFNPYSGVKTSILILDKSMARQTDNIGFFKVENDGFDLGAQRRPIGKNDLPQARIKIVEYLHRLRTRVSVEDIKSMTELVVLKEKITANGDYNLSAERYRENSISTANYPLQPLGSLLEIQSGYPFKSEQFETERGFPIIRIRDIKPNRTETKYIGEYDPSYIVRNGDLLIGMDGEFNSVIWQGGDALLNQRVCRLHSFKDCLKEYVARLIPIKLKEIEDGTYAVTVKHISAKQIKDIEIPLPPLEIQKEIVAEIEGYQKVIDGARAVVENYRPHITIDPSWPMVDLEEVCDINPESINPKIKFPGKSIFYIDISSVENGTGRFMGYTEIASTEIPSRARRAIRPNDVLLSTVRPNLKAFTLISDVKERAVASTGFAVLRSRIEVLDPAFLLNCMFADNAVEQMVGMMGKGAYPSINQSDVASIKIPLPPINTQHSIVADIKTEQMLVAANLELIDRFEKKIQDTIARIWGDGNIKQ